MSFRILNQAPQYLLEDGRVNAGGSLSFYETDLATPKGTWSDPGLVTPNANPVPLDAAGRSTTDIWGDGEYGVVMADADGVPIWTRNNVRDVDNPGAVIPALVEGQFLTNDGSVLGWQPILQVPDPTGYSGSILYSDGVLAYWGPAPTIPEPPEPDIEVTSASSTIGGGGSLKQLTQWGQGTIPASNAYTASLAVTFPAAFKSGSTPFVVITPAPGTQPSGPAVPYLGSVPSSTGFTAAVDVAEHGPPREILNNVVFLWLAIGVIDA